MYDALEQFGRQTEECHGVHSSVLLSRELSRSECGC
jgi:hypothetical protein